nr:substrate-binding domain-containing protein [Domibacillus mangrovi]
MERNIVVSMKTSAEAIELWKAHSKYDAWITYESWHYRLKNVTDLVRFSEDDKLYRGTPISITSTSDNKKESKQFIEYLKTESSHQVFQKWGWK